MILDQYTKAAQRLFTYAALNQSDTMFARVGGEIVYILDTSVIEAYWRRNPTEIAGQHGTNQLLKDSVGRYSGWLALKFIMEHRLPGQKNSAPAYLSPAHWNEAIDRIPHVERDTRTALQKASEIESRDGEVTDIDAALHKLSALTKPEQQLAKAQELRIGTTFEQVMTAVSTAERIRRTFLKDGRESGPSVRDLSANRYYSLLQTPKARHQDFRVWQAMIASKRNRHQAQQGTGRRNVDNDAQTLALIQALYRNTPESIGDGAAVRFVFVTGDHAIHDAYAEMRQRLGRERIPDFLRHPDVFAPILNLANMSTDQASFEKLRRVFDRVQEALAPLALYDDLNSGLGRTYAEQLKANVASWSANVEMICLANSQYILSDVGDSAYHSVAQLAGILATPQVRDAAATAVSASIGEIRDDHLQLVAQVALNKLLDASQRPNPRALSAEPRLPIKLIGVDFAAELGFKGKSTGSLYDLLHSFYGKSGLTKPEWLTAALKDAWDHPDRGPPAKLLASCIFMAVNDWDNARLCARICRMSIIHPKGSSLWLREARYCEALAIRMQLRSASEREEAENLLKDNIADHDDPLAVAREKVERATLNLTAIVIQSIENRAPFDDVVGDLLDLVPRKQIRVRFEDAVDQLVRQEARLAAPRPASDPATADQIRFQAQVNILFARVFSRLLGDVLAAQPPAPNDLAAALDAVRHAIAASGRAVPPVVRVYMAVANAIYSGTQAARAEARAAVAEAKQQEGLPSADEIEFKFLADWLARPDGNS